MRTGIFTSFLLVITFFQLSAQHPTPPSIKKEPKIFKEHGSERIDNYFWLSNPSDSNVINHLKAENAYVEAYMKNTKSLQEKLYQEIVDRIPQKDESLPVKQNGYWYYSRFEEGKQYPLMARKKETTSAPEEILLDIPTMAAPYKIFLVRGNTAAINNKLYAYGVDTAGDRRTMLHIKDLQTGKESPEIISNTSGNYVWANDSRTLYYVLLDHTVRPYKVMKHIVGTSSDQDQEVYTEVDSTYRVYLSKSDNRKYIFINIGSTNTSEVRYMPADQAGITNFMIQPRTKNVEYRATHFEGDHFHIYTNKDAKNFKFVSAPVKNPGMENWVDVIPANDKAFLENVEILKNHYVTQTKENGLSQIRFFDRRTKQWKQIDFGQEDYVAYMHMATDDYNSDSIRYYFTSLSTPGTDFMYNLQTGERKQIRQQKVGGGFDATKYETKRIWAMAGDSTQIPVSLVYRKDLFAKDASMPMLLYAYGSYGANMDPWFNSSVISLLDRGTIYAIAHIRGGQEMGREWYEKGRVLYKKNTFTDFIDVAQFLVNEKYTKPDRLFANGVSAGGMLMGAVTNLRPDLFKGIIAEVPWMDVITDMFNTDLPLTTLEYEEWGDPNNQEHYQYMLTWSPQDNVSAKNYPSILATGGLNDTQVPYFSPAKWVAKVREYNTGNNPVLFKVNMGAGHGGESGRFERQKLTALKFAFLLDQLEWDEEKKQFFVKKKAF